MIIRWFKHLLARIANSHPYVWFVAWRIVPHLPFMLPHEKSYYGFRHLALKEGGLFLDVGANIGSSALGFRQLVPNYRIFSIEANRYHEPALSRLKRRLGNFDYRIIGAGRERTQLILNTALYKGVYLHTGASLDLEHAQKGYAHNFSPRVVEKITWTQQNVDVIPLDDMNLAPDIIKIDAEGFDYEVLVGLKRTISACRPHVLVEYNATLGAQLETFCQELAYRLFAYDHVRDCFAYFDKHRELQTQLTQGTPVNIFLIPSEKVNLLPMCRLNGSGPGGMRTRVGGFTKFSIFMVDLSRGFPSMTRRNISDLGR